MQGHDRRELLARLARNWSKCTHREIDCVLNDVKGYCNQDAICSTVSSLLQHRLRYEQQTSQLQQHSNDINAPIRVQLPPTFLSANRNASELQLIDFYDSYGNCTIAPFDCELRFSLDNQQQHKREQQQQKQQQYSSGFLQRIRSIKAANSENESALSDNFFQPNNQYLQNRLAPVMSSLSQPKTAMIRKATDELQNPPKRQKANSITANEKPQLKTTSEQPIKSQAEPEPEPSAADNEATLRPRVLKLRKLLDKLSTTLSKSGGGGGGGSVLPPDISLLQQPQHIDFVSRTLRVWELSDEILLHICRQCIAANVSFQMSCLLIRHLLLSKIRMLQQPISRVLFSAVTLAAKLQPDAVVDALLVPLMVSTTASQQQKRYVMGSAHTEVVTRVLKLFAESSSKELIARFLLKTLTYSARDSSEEFAWTEFTIAVIQGILNLQQQHQQQSGAPMISEEAMSVLLMQLDQNAPKFASSLKFATLVFHLISKYPTQIARRRELVQHMLATNTTFMKQTALTALAKLT